jgi:hypothetical protein
MDPQSKLSGNFLTRKMLAFEHGMKISLVIKTKAKTLGTVVISGFTSEGQFIYKHATLNTGVENSSTFNLPDMPIMLSVVDSADDFQQGACFATLDLLMNGVKVLELCSGSIYRSKSISWPQTNTADKKPDGGLLSLTVGTDPAAGAAASITVGTNEIWKIRGIDVTLVTDATVVNRRMHLDAIITFVSRFSFFCDIEQAASTTRKYFFQPSTDMPDREDDGNILVAIPNDLVLYSGFKLETDVTGMVAGDNLSGITVNYELFFN